MDHPVEQSAAIRRVSILVERLARQNGVTPAEVWSQVAEYCRQRNEARRAHKWNGFDDESHPTVSRQE